MLRAHIVVIKTLEIKVRNTKFYACFPLKLTVNPLTFTILFQKRFLQGAFSCNAIFFRHHFFGRVISEETRTAFENSNRQESVSFG